MKINSFSVVLSDDNNTHMLISGRNYDIHVKNNVYDEIRSGKLEAVFLHYGRPALMLQVSDVTVGFKSVYVDEIVGINVIDS